MTFDPLIPGVVCIVLLVLAVALGGLRLRRGVPGPARMRMFGMVAFAAVIVANPAVGGASTPLDRRALDVLFVIDTTGSMAAEDYRGGVPRLDGVRADLLELSGALAGASFGLITFDSVAQVAVPWTTDLDTLQTAIGVLRQERTYYAIGSRIDEPLEAMGRMVPRRGAPGDEDRTTVVFFVSDGEQTVDEARRSFAALASDVDGGAVLGYGTTAGGRMRIFAGRTTEGPYLFDDRAGADAVSRYDESTLTGVASELGVDYVHRTGPGDLGGVVDDVVASAGRGHGARAGALHLTWIAGLGLVALVLWQAVATSGEITTSCRWFRAPSDGLAR